MIGQSIARTLARSCCRGFVPTKAGVSATTSTYAAAAECAGMRRTRRRVDGFPHSDYTAARVDCVRARASHCDRRAEYRPGSGLSEPPDTYRHRLHAGRSAGHHGARDCGEAHGDARPAGRHRQPARRRWHDRHPDRRGRDTRRPHAPFGFGVPRDLTVGLREAALRHAARLRGDHDHGNVLVHARRAAVAAGEDSAGPARAGASEAGAAQFQLRGQWQRNPFRRRASEKRRADRRRARHRRKGYPKR